jgi:tRNA threonylcarbamoyladenosine biosynthesis protein TsaB
MLLAIDTSTRFVGIALYNGVQVLSESTWVSNDYHTVELAPAVSQLLDRNAIEATDIQAIGVAIGPGSFTGLRIGLALAKGFTLARHIPLIGISTLDILAAAQAPSPEPLVAVLQAGRGRLVVGWYSYQEDNWHATGNPEIMNVHALSQRIQSPTFICGELTEEERRVLARKHKNIILASPAQSIRRPGYLAELAWNRWKSGHIDSPALLTPIYLHIGEPIPIGAAD